MPIINVFVAAGNEDSYEDAGGNNFPASVWLNGLSPDEKIGTIFVGAIPQNSIINTAYANVYIDNVVFDNPHGAFHFETNANPANFGAGANDISNRPKTASSTPWSVNLGLGAAQYVQTPSLVTPLQELVNSLTTIRINLLWYADSGFWNFRYLAFDSALLKPAEIYIDYSPPAGSPSMGAKLIAGKMV